MTGLAFSSLRAGKKYWLKNHGELFEFEILEVLHKDNFLLKDLNTLERYELFELVKYGQGKDFEIRELR